VTVDWRAVGWWDLPGPSRFLDRASTTVTGTESGTVGLSLPDPRPDGLLDALAQRIEQDTSAAVLRVDASSGLRGRSPTTMLATAAGLRMSGIRSMTEFLDAPSLSGLIFLVDGIPADEWYPWAYFLKLLRSERTRRARMLAPSLAIAIPTGVTPDDARAALGRDVQWIGQVSRLDTQAYIERLMGWPDDSLASRTAVSVAVEMAGWHPWMARFLVDLGPDEMLDPRAALAALPDVLQGRRPSWGNGLVDRWDGVAWVHTAALVAARLDDTIAARLWRGQVRALFPFLDQMRTAFAAKYEQRLLAHLPIIKDFHGRKKPYADPYELEHYDINELLKSDLPKREATLLLDCIALRRGMAHMDPGDGWRIKRVSETWEDVGHSFPDGCLGWEWPRCGQKLVMMVGPSGAGKTTWAKRRYDGTDIISADAIREEMFGSLTMDGDQGPVFERLRAEVVARLSVGRTVVIDATNLKREDRLSNVLLAPPDIPVEYVVIDRSMDEKPATAGWRSERPGLLETHAQLFERELSEILDGDGLGNVRIIDKRAMNTLSVETS
jgi:hypothetical protein